MCWAPSAPRRPQNTLVFYRRPSSGAPPAAASRPVPGLNGGRRPVPAARCRAGRLTRRPSHAVRPLRAAAGRRRGPQNTRVSCPPHATAALRVHAGHPARRRRGPPLAVLQRAAQRGARLNEGAPRRRQPSRAGPEWGVVSARRGRMPAAGRPATARFRGPAAAAPLKHDADHRLRWRMHALRGNSAVAPLAPPPA